MDGLQLQPTPALELVGACKLVWQPLVLPQVRLEILPRLLTLEQLHGQDVSYQNDGDVARAHHDVTNDEIQRRVVV